MKHISSVLAVTAVALLGPASSALAAPYPYYGQPRASQGFSYQYRMPGMPPVLQKQFAYPQQGIPQPDPRWQMKDRQAPVPVPPQPSQPPHPQRGPHGQPVTYPCNG